VVFKPQDRGSICFVVRDELADVTKKQAHPRNVVDDQYHPGVEAMLHNSGRHAVQWSSVAGVG